MDTASAIRDRILHLCAEHDLTINRLAERSGLSPSTVKNILYGKSKNPRIETIRRICDGFDLKLGPFFAAPEFDALEPEAE